MISRCLWLLLLLSVSAGVQANILVLNDGVAIAKEDVFQALKTYRGEHPPQTMDEAVLRQDEYRPSGGYIVLKRFQPQWLRLQMRNDGSQPRELVFDLRYSLLSEIHVRINEDGAVRDTVSGLNHPKNQRDMNVNTFQYRLTVPPRAQAQIDLSISSPTSPILAPRLYDLSESPRDVLQTNYFFGFIIGQIFAVGFFLVCYLVLLQRNRDILYLLLFCVLGITGILFHSGVLAHNFPAVFSSQASWVHIVIHGLTLALLAKLVQAFYSTQRKHYWVHQMLNGFFWFSLLMILALPMFAIELISAAFFGLQLLFFISVLWFTLFCLLNGRRGVPLLISLGMVLCISVLLARLLAAMEIVPIVGFMRFSYELAQGFMMNMLCVAVVGAMLKSQKNTIAASEKVLRIESEMQARSDVVAKITHDIKSPLTAILGAEQLLRDRADSLSAQEQDSYLSIIRTSGHMVLSMVNDVLLHAEVKRGHLVLHRDEIVIRQWLSETENTMRVAGTINARVQFTCSADADVPAIVIGDRRRLTQIVTNLLVNAFKFTDEGYVRLLVSLQQQEAKQCVLVFSVLDSGIGMSPEFIKRAFDSYSREASSAVAGKIGFGLGLAICKQLVTEMGGEINVNSVQGKGTMFRVALPFSLPEI